MVDGKGLLWFVFMFLLMIDAISCGRSILGPTLNWFNMVVKKKKDTEGQRCGGLCGQPEPCLRWRERVELWCRCCQSWSVDWANFPRLWGGSQEERQWTTDWVVQLRHSWSAVSPKDRVHCELDHTDGPCEPKNVHSCCDAAQPLWWLEDTNQVPCYSIMFSIFHSFPIFSCTSSLVLEWNFPFLQFLALDTNTSSGRRRRRKTMMMIKRKTQDRMSNSFFFENHFVGACNHIFNLDGWHVTM